MSDAKRLLINGNEAVAQAAFDARVNLGTGYPGTPSTEIFEHVERHAPGDVVAHWSSNEKTAYEAAIGVSMVGRRVLVAMKHVGLNVAADAFMNSAVTGTNGKTSCVEMTRQIWRMAGERAASRRSVAASAAPVAKRYNQPRNHVHEPSDPGWRPPPRGHVEDLLGDLGQPLEDGAAPGEDDAGVEAALEAGPADLGEDELARPYLEQTIAAYPADPAAFRRLALVHERNGRIER